MDDATESTSSETRFHPHGPDGGLGRPDARDAVADDEGEDPFDGDPAVDPDAALGERAVRPPTFAEAHAAVKVIAQQRGHATWSLEVIVWNDGRTGWSIWVADLSRHFGGRTANEAVSAYAVGSDPSTDVESIGDAVLDAPMPGEVAS